MAGIVKAVFGSPQSESPLSRKSQSFNDLSVGAHEDLQEGYEKPTTPKGSYQPAHETPDNAAAPVMKPSQGSSAKNTWQGVLAPGKNYHPNYKEVHKDYYDHSHDDDHSTSPDSVWDHYVRSERQRLFSEIDKNKDGFITADELHAKFGHSADVQQIIKAADTKGDGKIDLAQFTNLLKNS